ncbi:MAG: phosphate acetyltransferase [Simkaniaceae bacterium]|nr:phosphate acetyltransferase [Simkaniaceae bacterium]
MMQTILMVPIGLGVGLTTVSCGLVHALESQGISAKYLNPFSKTDQFSEEDVLHLLSTGQEEVILEKILREVEVLEERGGALILQGMISMQDRPFASSVNNMIAKALNAKVIFITTPEGKSPSDLKEHIIIGTKPYGGIDDPKTIGCMINKVGAPIDQYGNARIDLFDLPENIEEETALCEIFKASRFKVLGCFPWKRALMAPRAQDVAKFLNAEILSKGTIETSRVNYFAIAASTLERIPNVLNPDVMIITPSDRSDAILATCMAYLSGVKIAGLLLTGGGLPSKCTMKLCDRAMEKGLPVILVNTDTLRTAISLQKLNVKIPDDDIERSNALKEYIAYYIDTSWIKEHLSHREEKTFSPPAFKYQLIEKAKKAHKKIVLPEGEESRIIKAAVISNEKKIAKITLLGNPDVIRSKAEKIGVTLSDEIEIVDPNLLREKYLPTLMKLRAHKGITEKVAKESLQNCIVVGTLMLYEGLVDGLVAGTVHTTANTIRPALTLIKTVPNVSKVSSVFFMCLPKQVLVYGDCAVNQNPTASELAEIAIQSADSAKQFGIEPRIAMINYSTGASGSGADVVKVNEATKIVQEKRPDLMIDGPLQYDAAYSPEVAKQKAPNSTVAGRATVYIFPDLNTANTTYKAVQRSADVLSIGPMLQGLKKPVNDLSRGALVEDIVYTIAVTAIQST